MTENGTSFVETCERGHAIPTVQTVLGAIAASELGFTLSHEHIIVSNGQDRQRTFEVAVAKRGSVRPSASSSRGYGSFRRIAHRR